jgi:hypothetical protein
MPVPSVTNAQGQVSVIQMQWSPEQVLKGPLTKPTIVHISHIKKENQKKK